MINVDGNKIFYSPNVADLNSTPSRDVFGYLIASQGLTIHTSPIDVVEKLYELRRMSTTYSPYITTILLNIIVSDSLDDYMDILTDEPEKFITSEGEIVDVKELIFYKNMVSEVTHL